MTGAASAGGFDVAFDLDLDVFDGPFDLLVTLILKDEIDIWEVRVSRIIAEYVLRLVDDGEFDLDATSQFVVLVASLLEMKSRLLLSEPMDEDDLEELDPREAAEQLVARLVRYGQFKNAGRALEERWHEHAARMYRNAPVPEALRRRPLTDELPSAALVGALAPLLREPQRPDTTHVMDLAVSLVEELRRLREILGDRRSFTFSAVAPADRLERCVTFFALLELHSSGEATLRQRHHLADISVTSVA